MRRRARRRPADELRAGAEQIAGLDLAAARRRAAETATSVEISGDVVKYVMEGAVSGIDTEPSVDESGTEVLRSPSSTRYQNEAIAAVHRITRRRVRGFIPNATRSPISPPTPTSLNQFTSRAEAAETWIGRHPVAVTVAGTLLVTAARVRALGQARRVRGRARRRLGLDHRRGRRASGPLADLAQRGLARVRRRGRRRGRSAPPVPRIGGRHLGNLFNSHFGMGVRIAALRRSAPRPAPGLDPDHGRDADHRDRGRPGRDLLVHPDRPARAAVVGASDLPRHRHRDRDRADQARQRPSPTGSGPGSR